MATRLFGADQSIEDKLRRLEALRKALEKDNSALRDKLDRRQDMVDAVIAAVEPFPEFQPPKDPGEFPKKRHKVALVLILSDWHIGELVRPEEVDGLNEYTYAVACKRALNITDDVISWAGLHSSAYEVVEVCVLTLGDLLSGNIHEELVENAEFTLPHAISKAADLLAEVYKRMAAAFPRVRALQVAGGNHDRTTKKPRFKRRVDESWAMLVHQIAAAKMANVKHFTVEAPQSFTPDFTIAGRVYHATHGDVVKGSMGIPYYGFWRYMSRVATKRMDTNLPSVSCFLFGHYHTFSILDDGRAILNGSLIGPTEYDQGAQRFARPRQVAFLASPKHGPFNITAFEGRQ